MKKWRVASRENQKPCSGLSKIRHIDPLKPDPERVQRAVAKLRSGGMVVFPTRHLYGLGVDALNPGAVESVYTVKQRPREQPLLILVASREEVRKYARVDVHGAQALMDAFWPGKLTIVLEARSVLSSALTGGTGRIGVRVPGHPVSQALVREMATPLTATSANLSGQTGCHRIEDLDPAIAVAADLVLDAGPLVPGIGSTVVDVQPDSIKILREGAITATEIKAVNPVG